MDSRRFAETIGRVNTQDWEQRIHQHGSAENVAAAVAAAPPPPRRRQQDGLKLKEGDGKVLVLNIRRLTEERVNLLEDEEVRETMVKAWVESTSSENLHEVLHIGILVYCGLQYLCTQKLLMPARSAYIYLQLFHANKGCFIYTEASYHSWAQLPLIR